MSNKSATPQHRTVGLWVRGAALAIEAITMSEQVIDQLGILTRLMFSSVVERLCDLLIASADFERVRISQEAGECWKLGDVNISGNENDENVYVIDSNVDEITSGAITEWEDALKDDTELSKVIDAMRNENFIELEKVWSMVKEEFVWITQC
ncbi:hypothetical protein NDU88_006993 [Pleurodeles waltl]|uniref:Uncharacterized protein n=1 Tax=Pleurodeles waltl TaxID=8319 RepID=A0AAV7UMM4_PLEWA|nr:hypothetical protein NDU88_006993 [Pleurodeles waltl]